MFEGHWPLIVSKWVDTWTATFSSGMGYKYVPKMSPPSTFILIWWFLSSAISCLSQIIPFTEWQSKFQMWNLRKVGKQTICRIWKDNIYVKTVGRDVKANTYFFFLCLHIHVRRQNFWSKICFVTNFKIPSNDTILQWNTSQPVNF